MNQDTDQDEDEGLCTVCHGNGRYHIRTDDGDFETVKIKNCEACDGTGYQTEDGDVN